MFKKFFLGRDIWRESFPGILLVTENERVAVEIRVRFDGPTELEIEGGFPRWPSNLGLLLCPGKMRLLGSWFSLNEARLLFSLMSSGLKKLALLSKLPQDESLKLFFRVSTGLLGRCIEYI